MSLSNVPALTIDAAGVALPSEADILAGVLADLNDAFGGNLNTALDTPQGQWASSLTAIIGDRNAQIALLAAMIDPDTASGAFQDAIGRLALIERNPFQTFACRAADVGGGLDWRCQREFTGLAAEIGKAQLDTDGVAGVALARQIGGQAFA